MKTGILLVNLGSPDSPSTQDVRSYLKEFLSDPRVIDIGALPRFLLLHLFILPFRPKKSAHAYSQIWKKEGSPLIYFTELLAKKLQQKEKKAVRYAMRYGEPTISSQLEQLADCERILVVPLYPQYASASTGSSLEVVYDWASKKWNAPNISVLPAFFQDSRFTSSVAKVTKKHLGKIRFEPDHFLFSFHGLPERQIQKSNINCLSNQDCCTHPGERLQFCYRAQCFATAFAVAKELRISPKKYTVSFQSRLGRTPWIKPYSDKILEELPANGIRKLAVLSPSFTADCLETLEEIEIRGKDTFLKAGGEAFAYIPAVNAESVWVDALASMLNEI